MTHQTNHALSMTEHNKRIMEFSSVVNSKNSTEEQQVTALEELVKLCPGVDTWNERLLLKRLQMADTHKERFTLLGELARLFKQGRSGKNRAKHAHYLRKRHAELCELLKDQLNTTSRPGVRIRILRNILSLLRGENRKPYEQELAKSTNDFVQSLMLALLKASTLQARIRIHQSLCWAQPGNSHHKEQLARLAQTLSRRQHLRKQLAATTNLEERVCILRILRVLVDERERRMLERRLQRDTSALEKLLLRKIDRTDEPHELADLYSRLCSLVPDTYDEKHKRFMQLCESLPQDGHPIDAARAVAALTAR